MLKKTHTHIQKIFATVIQSCKGVMCPRNWIPFNNTDYFLLKELKGSHQKIRISFGHFPKVASTPPPPFWM